MGLVLLDRVLHGCMSVSIDRHIYLLALFMVHEIKATCVLNLMLLFFVLCPWSLTMVNHSPGPFNKTWLTMDDYDCLTMEYHGSPW